MNAKGRPGIGLIQFILAHSCVTDLIFCLSLSPVVTCAQGNVASEKEFSLKDLNNSNTNDQEEFSDGAIRKMREKSDCEFEAKEFDRNGMLSGEEFLRSPDRTDDERRERLREAFDRRDSDGDGTITKKQFLSGKAGVELQFAKDYFAIVDADSNDVLDEDEFTDLDQIADEPRIVFQYHDFNRDGQLTMEEYIEHSKGKASESARWELFAKFDRDQDGRLTIDEYIALKSLMIRNQKISKMPREQQDFARYDSNDDGKVTLVEFSEFSETRGDNMPHAERLFAALNQNSDDWLTHQELKLLSSADPAVQFAIRDIDGNGDLTVEEQIGNTRGGKYEKGRRLYFEHRDVDGNELLSPSEFSLGDDDRRVMFSQRDVDRSETVTLEEQLAGNVGTPMGERLRVRFFARDLNHDGLLTHEEFIRGHRDELVVFNQLDTNRNELLSVDEFLSTSKATRDEERVRQRFLMHDRDADGALSIEEFSVSDQDAAEERRIQLLIPEEREFARLDESKNGRISPEEFAARHGTAAYVRAHEKRLFDALDGSRDGSLDLNEFLAMDEPDPHPRIAFARSDLDGDGQLVIKEFFGLAPPQLRLGQQTIFVDLDADQSQALSVEEFMQSERGKKNRSLRAWFSSFIQSLLNWRISLAILFDVTVICLIVSAIHHRLSRRKTSQASANV